MKNIENVYSLSPLQQGLLFHQNYDPASRVYHQQVSLAIEGALDAAVFADAWRQLMTRHAVLRTGFLWEDLDDAFQIVHTELPLPLTQLDWRTRADAGHALSALELEQRNAAFAFDEAPLMRICLVRLAEQRWHMVWTFHHILLDGWSVGLALRDWLEIYGSLSLGASPALAPVRAYHDYIGWLAEQDAGAAETYWRGQLHDFTEPTPLPALVASRDVPAGAPCAEQHLLLSNQETEAIAALARTLQVTLNTVVQGAWALLLGGYAGREEVLFGVTSGGRPDALQGADDMVGLFINTLPLRTGWSDRPLLGDWLRRIQDANIELRQFEYTPLSKLRNYSAIASGQSLFESILVFENFPLDEALGSGAGGLTFSTGEAAPDTGSVTLTQGRNNYPLSLIVAPSERLELTLSYDRSRLGETEVRAMIARLHALLRAMPAHALTPAQELARADAIEQERLIAWGTGTPLDVPACCLHQLFERHADVAPQQAAVTSPAGTISYAELESQANRLANHVLGLGLEAGDVVAIALERSPQFVVAMLATLKAGGCYLPLDLKQPPARLAGLLADSGARYVICQDDWNPPMPVAAIRLGSITGHDVRPQIASLHPDHPAYLIYTSGSTGQPKGVLLPHRAIVDYVDGVLHTLALPPASRFALVSTIAADLGHTQLFGALCGGGTLVLVDEDTAFQPAALADFMLREQVDVLKITPSQLRGLLAAHASADLLPRHTLIFGGEAFESALLVHIAALAPTLRIFNHYGPTESTVGAVVNRLDGHAFDAAIPLGKPLPNRRLYVLDDERKPVGMGIPGELYIGGEALATGYLGAPTLTAERFVPDPFAGGARRMYRTGDRVRWLANGELAFIGRVDSQVKIRGHRVELGEVEAQIRQLSPHIVQVLARLAEVPDQGPRLLAYVVANGSLSSDKLRSDLAARLPEHMIPSAFIQLDAIPLNANGKPDTRALPLPDSRASSARQHVAPRNDLEATLADIWQNVLKRDRIGIDDDFFELGGDSILSLQIIARANQNGIKITPKQLFAHRSVAQLSAHLSSGLSEAAPAPTRALPLSAGQRARLEHGVPPATWRCIALERPVTPEHLRMALAALCARHQCLQLQIAQDARGEWRQSLAATSAVLQLRQVAPAMLDDASVLAALAAPVAGLQAWLLDTGTSQALLLAAPGLMADEESWPVLLEDFNLALSQAAFGRPLALSPSKLDFAEWAVQQDSHAHEDDLDAAWEHWLGFADTDVARIDVPSIVSQLTTYTLTTGQTAQLERLRQRMHLGWPTLIAMALTAEFAGEIVLIDLPAGRPRDHRIAGALSHNVPCFLRVAAESSPLKQLRTIETQLASAQRDYGVLRHLSDNSYLKEPLLALPAPQIGVTFTGDWDSHREPYAVLGAMLAASRAPASGHALQISASVNQGQLVLDCQGPLTGKGECLVGRLLELASLCEHPQARPDSSAFPLCVDAASLPLDWSVVEDVYPLVPTQHGMLLHTLMAPDSGVYLVQQRYRWDGHLDREALENAWDQLLARHPILRTAFWWQGDLAPVQYVQRELAPSFAWHDLRMLDADAQSRQLESELAAESTRGFDLARAPLTFLRVFQLADNQFELARSYHHILSDGWSFGLVMEDLLGLYRAALRGEPAALKPVRPYRDYIAWLAAQDDASAAAFWTNELAGFTEPTSLPVAAPEAAGATLGCADVDALLSVDQTRRMQQLCQQHQLTPNTWVQGAWALLLARYSGAPEVLFGVTVAGRPADLQGAEEMVGLFINTLPLRVAIPDEQPLATWLRQLLSHNLELRDFEHTPLVDIQGCSAVERGRSLFDTLVVFENAPFGAQEAAGALDANIDMQHDRSHTNYPVTVMAMPGERLGLRISYQLGRFGAATMERMMGHLRELLSQMIACPESAIGKLGMLPLAEQQAMAAWNSSAHDFQLDRSYAELFSQAASRHPERVAAVCSGHSLSYAELDQRSNRIAHALLARGAQADTIVTLMAERGLELLAMMIGVLKAGAAFQPLDVSHPPRRLAELLGLSGAPLLLVAGDGAALADQVLAMTDRAPVCLDARACAHHGDASPPLAASAPGNLAYVIFTSGSTGKPKGAMVEQRGMLNNIFGKLPAIGLGEHDRLAQTASPAFDISVWQFLAAPLFGATVHILPDAVAHDPQRLMQAIDEDGITLLEIVPSMLRAMLDGDAHPAHLSTLRWLMSIGEALPPVLCTRWLERFPAVPLMNLYGPAECADNIAFHAIDSAPSAECVHMPVGRPTANNQLFVLDSAMRMVPIGVPGEICTSGAGVGRGYLNDPQRTDAVFVAHPFEPAARFYRTGDLGRYRADGAIEFLGRRDQQVKVQGHRIELGEIESRLMQHAQVGTAAVLALPAADGGQRLVAFWQAKHGATADSADLRAFIEEALPAYMAPQVFLSLEHMPLNANGKLDRIALARLVPVPGQVDDAIPLIAPRSDSEIRLAAIWSNLLKVEQVGMHDNFFALGGHSLLATQLASRIRAGFSVNLPLRAVFDHPTLSALAGVLDTLAATRAGTVLPPIAAASRDAVLPLSFAQQRLWFLEQLAPGSGMLNLPFALRLTGKRDVDSLRRSFELLVARHEVLRTAFVSIDGVPRLRIAATERFELPVSDCRGMSRASIEQAIRSGLERGFDLARAPLLRAELLLADDNEAYLSVALHHITADGWSLALLVNDLADAYRALCAGAEPELMTQQLQYADYAQWQRSHLPGPAWQQQLDYWRSQLENAPGPLSLPGFTAAPGSEAGRHRGTLPAALSHGLRQFSERHNASPFMVLYAALNVLLHQQTGSGDVVIGTDVANRHHGETEGMVGFFVNQLVLRCRLNGEQTVASLMADCRRIALDAYQHQDLPFEALVADLLPQRDSDRTPFFQIKLILQNIPQRDLVLGALAVEELELEPHDTELDLLINVIPDGESYTIVYDYARKRYDAAAIAQLDALFAATLHLIVSGEQLQVGQVCEQLLQGALRNLHQSQAASRPTLGTVRRKPVTL
ncbi:non-ribosomal peptide synthetase [Massilia scottii]|uniref:non-ribosomal peptide synthetase n=1 Tax=Massilia scottii TaxID=3057166 RepID=UPI0027968790|nr:non-ribosomal peptide synthetase [Massilia sp. CCM 9029]MDQ1831843.1 amino acid adenylation domain-containing protein [Massilia sp. CCM 9029]